MNGSHTGTGAFTVAKGATLSGTGSIAAPVTLASGSTLYAGDTLVVNKNTLTFGGKFTANSGSQFVVPVRESSTNYRVNSVTFKGNVTLNNPVLILSFDDTTSEVNIPVGTELKLFTVTGKISGSFARISPEYPATGCVWDTSDLCSKGILRVVADPALSIKDSEIDVNSSVNSYDLNGVKTHDVKGKIVIRKNQKIKL